MRKLLSSFLIVLLFIAGCRSSATIQANLQIALTIVPSTPSVGEAEALVTLTDSNGDPVTNATVSLRGDMTHAGMQPVLREATANENGVYTLPYEWTMAGDWSVEVMVTLPDGTTATQMFDYEVSGS